MAIHPNPDRDTHFMKESWGTTRLITDYYSLPVDQKRKNDPPQNRLSKPCGGKDGFDDYVEWFT